MAYYYNGQGFQLQHQTGAYDLLDRAYARTAANSPFDAANNLINYFQLNNAKEALLDAANPYDGLTARQKLQQLGLNNSYTLNALDSLTTAYNAESTNIANARQAASDFNTEPLLSEAYRVRATGDPTQIAAFNDKLKQTMNAWVASGAVTPETARKLYTDLNPVKQEVANIGLTRAQTNSANAGARAANASALLNEQKALDVAMEQQAIKDYSMLTSAGATDIQSAASLASTWGWPRSRFLTAMNAGKIPRYTPLYGDMSTQASTIKLNNEIANNNNIDLGQITVDNVQTPQMQSEIPKQDSVIASANTLVNPSNILEGGNTTVPDTGVYTPAVLKQNVPQQLENKLNTNTNAASPIPESPSTEPIVTPQDLSLGMPSANINTAPVVNTNNSQVPTINAESLQQNIPENLEQQIPQQNQQVQTDSSKLNTIANQSTIDSGGAVINTFENGTPYIDVGNNATYTNDGSWKFNKKTPTNQVSAFDVATVENSLTDINRRAGGNLGNFFNFKATGNKLELVPTEYIQNFLKRNPEYASNVDQMRSEVLQAYKPLLTNKNLPAAVAHMQAVFGDTVATKNKGKTLIKDLVQISDNNTLYNDANNTVDRIYDLNGSVEDINNVRNADIIELSNIANSKLTTEDNLKFLGRLMQKGPEVISTKLNNAVAKATDSAKIIYSDIQAEQARVDELTALEEGYNLAKNSGTSFSHFATAMRTSDNPRLKTTYNTLQRNAVIYDVSNDSKTKASEVEDRIDLNAKTTAEYETSAQKLAKQLQTDLNIPQEAAMYCVAAAGVTPNRGIMNSRFPAISSTNNMMYINTEEAYRQASLYKTWIADPNGRYSINEMRNRLSAATTSYNEFINATKALETASTKFSKTPATLASGGYSIKNIINTDGTTTSTIGLGTINSKNDITTQGSTISTVKNNISNLDKAIQTVIAAYAKMNQNARPVSESRIVFDTANQINRSVDSNYGIYSDKTTSSKNKVPKYNSYLTGSREDYNNSVDNVNNSNNITYSSDTIQSLKNFSSTSNFKKSASDLMTNNVSPNNLNTTNLVNGRSTPFNQVQELFNMGSTNPAAYTILAEDSERNYGVTEGTIEKYTLAANTPYKDNYGNTVMGSHVAQVRLGDLYLQGVPGILKKDSGLAEAYYLQAARQGSAEAQYKLGNYYFNNKDYNNAASWIRKAAEQGHIEAMRTLGYFYQHSSLFDNIKPSELQSLSPNSVYLRNWFERSKSKNKKSSIQNWLDDINDVKEFKKKQANDKDSAQYWYNLAKEQEKRLK